MTTRSRLITAAGLQLMPFLLGAFTATAPMQARAEAPEGETRYLCCNMRLGKDWLSDINYNEEGMTVLPYGTPVKILEVSRNRVRVEIGGKAYKFNNDYSRKLGMPEFIKRYLLVEDPRPAQKDLPAPVRQAIESFTVVPGMTRDQVLLAVAYPIADETPDLKANVWRYWQLSTIEYKVKFDADGIVTDVAVKDENSHEGDEKCAVNVYRPDWSMGDDRTHSYVQVDGKMIGKLRTSETVCLKLTPGNHQVEVRNEIFFSPGMVVANMQVEVPESGAAQFLRYQRRVTGVMGGVVRTEDKLITATEGQWRKRQ